MLTQSILFDDLTCEAIKQLKSALLTDNTSYIVRVAIASLQKNLNQNSFCGIFHNTVDNCSQLSIPRLPGMTDRIIRSQMERFNLTSDEYETIVRQVVDGFASSGSTIKNPEAAIFGACRRYAKKRDGQTTETPAAETPQSSDDESVFDLQEKLG